MRSMGTGDESGVGEDGNFYDNEVTRGELLERPCAHLYETGGMRRVHVRGHENVLKRLLIQVSGFNLGLLMRQQLGVGTPRGLQGWICLVLLLILSLWKRLKGLFGLIPTAQTQKSSPDYARTVIRS